MTDSISLTPLGGLGETGALNCMVYHDDHTAFLVDCGVSFVDERHPGAQLIIPDFKYLERFDDRLEAVVLTHGHEDHIGALPYLLRQRNLPVYATPFTKGILQHKFVEHGLEDVDIRDITFGKKFSLGDFTIEPVFVNHSIMDVAALHIERKGVTAFHCTDFKIDHSAADGNVIDLVRIKEIGEQGLDLLMSDSTNSLSPGWTNSETTVRANLIEEISKIDGRILVSLFSSNTFRLKSIVECAKITGRKLAFTGRSTKQYVKVAKELGRFNTTGVDILDVEEITRYPDNKVLVVVTGSQAEHRSVLFRMSHDMFRPFRLKKGDTLIMSSKIIPGNEGAVLGMFNRLALLGAKVISRSLEPIHASGHAKQDELKELVRLTKPKFFLPIHGEYRHLMHHCELAMEEGLKLDQTLIALDGDTVELDKKGIGIVDHNEVEHRYVSENPKHMISKNAIKRRRKLSFNGLVVVSAQYNDATRLLDSLQIQSQGLFGGEIEDTAISGLYDFIYNKLDDLGGVDREKLEKHLKVEVRHFYKLNYHVRPEVIVMVHDVLGG